MKNLKEKIEKAPLLPKKQVEEAMKVIEAHMEQATRDYKRQQAECEIAAKKAYLTE